MIFSSIEFLLYFLPIFLFFYGITPARYRNLTLLAGSLVFYSFGDVKHLVLLLLSVGVNYLIGLRLGKRANDEDSIHKKEKHRFLFLAAVAGNLFVLALFKSRQQILGLPLGISFYTFQILSYLIDIHRGEIQAESSFLKFSVYICMFPRLLSGPIFSYSEISEQLEKRAFTAESVQDGLKLATLGLASKVLLADRIGLLWNEIQTTGFESISTPLAWIAAIAFSMNIYFDFYGYSLITIGLGRMLGFHLPDNFREPYMSRGVRDFYRRWHITLGSWFRRYVYIPLGGSHCSEARTALNLLTVWICTSLWHGLTLNYLIWGLLLWLLIVIERQIEHLGLFCNARLLPRLYLWIVIPVTWMCFAITDQTQLDIYLGRMFHLTEGVNIYAGDWLKALSNYGVLLAVCAAACTPLIRKLYGRLKNNIVGQILLGLLFWLCVLHIWRDGQNPFRYLNF